MIGIAVLAVVLAYLLILGAFVLAVHIGHRRPAHLSRSDARAIRRGVILGRRAHHDYTAQYQVTRNPVMIRAFIRTYARTAEPITSTSASWA